MTQDALIWVRRNVGETEKGEVMGKSQDRRHSNRKKMATKYYNYN